MATPERITDSQALDQIQTWMSGRLWDGAADFLEAIAEVVRKSGRAIAEADADAPLWNEDTECDCCRHYDHDGADCRRCTQCGEWCEDCGEIALLHDSGLCEDCCHKVGCDCGAELDDDEDTEPEHVCDDDCRSYGCPHRFDPEPEASR